ncbi:MAG: CoA-binding protein, partial [Desulfobacterales bacterium]|nr:CoA-binding protein [Desulfobacterales bacterium]
MAADAAEAETAAGEIGYPVVIKADAQSIVHKSDMGGVAVNLENAEAVRAAVEEMKGKFDAPDLRFFIQEFLPGGLEVIFGAKAEPGLGHIIMFGLGGIYVEVMKDVVFNLTPVTTAEAAEMLAEIQGAPLLKGVRGQSGVDRSALTDIILRLSQLVTDLPEIQEMDLNPAMAFEDGAHVVDARIAL